MHLSSALSVRTAGCRGVLLGVLMLSVGLLSAGCGSTPGAGSPPSDPARPAAAGAVKAEPAPTGPQVVVEGGGEDGRDVSIPLPRWPEDGNLVALRQEVRPDLRFAVDQQSLQLVGGNEIRFTMVARSGTGVRTVTFEAIRCGWRDRILLATGTPDGRWTPVRAARRVPLDRAADPVGMRALLHRDIFCPGGVAPADLRELQAALRSGLHPRAVLD